MKAAESQADAVQMSEGIQAGVTIDRGTKGKKKLTHIANGQATG